MKFRVLMGMTAFCVVLCCAGVAGAQNYSFTTQDVPGAALTALQGANNRGETVGFYQDDANGQHNYRAFRGVFTTFDLPGAFANAARAINSRGDIVGAWFDAPTSSQTAHGFLFSGGVFTTVDFPGAGYTVLGGISNEGVTVGSYCASLGCADPDDIEHSFIRGKDGTMTPFDYPAALLTEAYGINALGDVVGFFLGSHGLRGFLLKDGVFSEIHPPNALNSSQARGINSRGQICGQFRGTDHRTHGYVLSGGVYTQLDVPGAFATRCRSIDDRGVVAGNYDDVDADGNIHTHGFVATPSH